MVPLPVPASSVPPLPVIVPPVQVMVLVTERKPAPVSVPADNVKPPGEVTPPMESVPPVIESVPAPETVPFGVMVYVEEGKSSTAPLLMVNGASPLPPPARESVPVKMFVLPGDELL